MKHLEIHSDSKTIQDFMINQNNANKPYDTKKHYVNI